MLPYFVYSYVHTPMSMPERVPPFKGRMRFIGSVGAKCCPCRALDEGGIFFWGGRSLGVLWEVSFDVQCVLVFTSTFEGHRTEFLWGAGG